VRVRRHISVLYLGQKGGGAKFALRIVQLIESNSYFQFRNAIIRKDNEIYDEFNRETVISLFERGPSIQSLIRLAIFYLFPTHLLRITKLRKGDICIVPMISPLGLHIERILERKGIILIRFFHDATRHPGDKWPTNRTIKKIVKSSLVLITLSKNVAIELKRFSPTSKIFACTHPVFHFMETEHTLELPTPYILFLGRLRKYKGLQTLILAFPKLQDPRIHLVIAGDGKFRLALPPKTFLLNRWLTESEISELIERADLVAFPYIESSQSGLLPYCISKNKKIVISPSSGLLEQSKGYANCTVSIDFSAEGFAKSLRDGLKMDKINTPHRKDDNIQIEKCLIDAVHEFE